MKTSSIITLAGVIAVGTIGAAYFLDFDVTQEAKLPNVDVTVEGGQLPKVDVEAGSVEVGTKEVTVQVPEVKMVDKTVTVPTVNVEPATE